MTRKVNDLGIGEVVMSVTDAITITGLVKFALEHLTDDFEDEELCKLMRREIDLCNALDKLV